MVMPVAPFFFILPLLLKANSIIPAFADDTRSTDLLATFFDDGSNLPDIASRHRCFRIPVSADKRTHS